MNLSDIRFLLFLAMSIYIDIVKVKVYIISTKGREPMKLINENLISTTGTDAFPDVASSLHPCSVVAIQENNMCNTLASDSELRNEILMHKISMIHTIGTPESEDRKADLRNILWKKGYFNPFPYMQLNRKIDAEASALKELEIPVCRICGETCDVCTFHGTPLDQEKAIQEAIEAQAEQERLRKLKMQSLESNTHLMNQLLTGNY